MQVTSSGAAAAWDTPTIEPILPSSVNAYDPSNPDNGGTLDSAPQQQDSNAGYSDTAEPQPLQPSPAPGFEPLYTKPLLVDPATGEALEVMHTKPLQISLDGSGPVDYGVNKPLQIDGAPQTYVGYNKPLLVDPATGEALEVMHTKPLQISLDGSGPVDYGVNKPLQIDDVPQTYVGYNKPLLVDPATGQAAELVHTKPLQITPESAVQAAPAQAASPHAATAVAAPKASAMEIAALELLLAEPANQDMIAQFGPPLAPLNTGTDVGSGIQARFGADLGARLTQLQEAQNNVRGQFLKALDEAQQHPGPDVAGSELVQLYSGNSDNGGVSEQSLLHITHPIDAEQAKAASSKADQFVPGARTEWRFTDPAEFAKAYAAGDSPAQKAFASLHGKDPLQFHEAVEQGGGDAGPYLEPAYYTLGEAKLVTGGQTVDDKGNPGGWREASLEKTQLTPEQSRRLINNEYLWFDPVNGWSTDLENNIRPSNSFLDKAIPLVFAGGLTMITAGAFGITAASASTSLGQSMALGAISSASMQLTTGGKLDLGNILRSALTAGVTFGVTKFTELGSLLSSTDTATRTLGHLGKAGLQGLLQEATGGQFKDGLTNSLISSVAGEVGKSLESQIAEFSKNGTLSVQEASTLRLMSRAASSAVRVAGSGGDAAGFASDFLGGLMEEANPFAGKAEAGGKADKANKADNTNTTSNTSQGEKPDNGWVQSLGASDVDPTQAQGLRPGSSLQGLRVSGDALSGWGDGIGGAGHGQSRDGLGNALGNAVVDSMQPDVPAVASADEKARIREMFADGPGGSVAGGGLRFGGPASGTMRFSDSTLAEWSAESDRRIRAEPYMTLDDVPDMYPGHQVAGPGGIPSSQGVPAIDPRYEGRLASVLSTNTANSTDDFTTRRHLAALDAKINALSERIDGLYGNDAGLRGALEAERDMYERAKAITLGSTPMERAETLAVGKVLGLAPSMDVAEARSLIDQWRDNRLDSSNPLHRDIHAALLDPRVTRGLLGVDILGYDGGNGPSGMLNLPRGLAAPAREVSYVGRTGFGLTNRAAADAADAAGGVRVVSTSSVEEQARVLAGSVPGLEERQARALLDAAHSRDLEVVLGGSRVRSYFGQGTFRPDSDLDIGFNNENLSSGKLGRVLDSFDNAGGLRAERGIRIFTGNQTQKVPRIESPQEFFQRSGFRTEPGRVGEPFNPSGSITARRDGTIVYEPPRR